MTNLKSGLSGCKIELLRDDVLRKYSSSPEYNKRLVAQSKKQSMFAHFVLMDVDSPRVYQVNLGDLYSFDMEYVSGFSFDEYFSHADVRSVNNILNSLYDYFDFLIDNSKRYHDSVSKKIFIDKIKTLNQSDYLDYLLQVCSDNDLNVPYSFCHGDLTFANVIFHPKRMYFIDFLDSFIDSYLVDFAKLKQDLYYHWNLRIQGNNNLRLYQIYYYLWSKMENRYSQYLNTVAFKVLDALTLLRIEPYLTNNRHRSILKTLVETTDLYEDFSRSNGGQVVSLPRYATEVDADAPKEE